MTAPVGRKEASPMFAHLDVFQWRLLFVAAFAVALAAFVVGALAWRAVRVRRRLRADSRLPLAGASSRRTSGRDAPPSRLAPAGPLASPRASRRHPWTSSSWR
jgi:hypothetical protein